ncbi:transposase [Paenibacillus aquistagni]|nr:transposase [Paenibacillus aquistagni]
MCERMLPEALRVEDRFHVHGYVVEAVQTVRKNIQGKLTSREKSILKARSQLLNSQKASL